MVMFRGGPTFSFMIHVALCKMYEIATAVFYLLQYFSIKLETTSKPTSCD